MLFNILIGIFKRHDIRYSFLRKRILNAFNNLEKISKEKGPYFVFSHILTPHQPFLFGKDGEFIMPKTNYYTEWFPITEGRNREQYIAEYRDQLTYINKRMQQVISRILSDSPVPPIIVLQSDHGPCANLDPESAKNSDHTERMGILNAYYFPDQDYSELYKTITPVNSFRIILDHFFGEDLELLEDRSYFTSWSKTYDFIEVTDKVNIMNSEDAILNY